MEEYSRQILRIVIAQISQTIGWHGTQMTTLESLAGVLQKYLLELSVRCYRYSEHCGRTEVILDDVGLAFRDFNINMSELLEYIERWRSLPCAVDVPRYPAQNPREVIMTPAHPQNQKPNRMVGVKLTRTKQGSFRASSIIKDITNTAPPSFTGGNAKTRKLSQALKDRTSSVVMTGGGYTYAWREGKLPNSKLAAIKEPDYDECSNPGRYSLRPNRHAIYSYVESPKRTAEKGKANGGGQGPPLKSSSPGRGASIR